MGETQTAMCFGQKVVGRTMAGLHCLLLLFRRTSPVFRLTCENPEGFRNQCVNALNFPLLRTSVYSIQ
ncbi:MAG: hypothetical protein BWX80_00805 [Candidatus Hydrogenedentes bacterium ADurb.Bin101]|nr:MAG: hypothetical protein BWX80_00805 [Candidatus Hydrogenedentes bacterium ADurb.Bin101]